MLVGCKPLSFVPYRPAWVKPWPKGETSLRPQGFNVASGKS
jgi:hypothetical protein